jgi:amidohydrolase family protein
MATPVGNEAIRACISTRRRRSPASGAPCAVPGSTAADRILLGTDFPNIPSPYLHQLEALARLEFGAPWLRAAGHDNAARLLGR